ncbi:hypothetical protein NC652_039614 [Populus alba x Populus x berolinensis]|nr:hypothetical protein NC652_039614 [Populus alba x Populus x berolinensis]
MIRKKYHQVSPQDGARLNKYIKPPNPSRKITSYIDSVLAQLLNKQFYASASVVQDPSLQLGKDTMSLTAGGDWMCSACQHLNFKKRETCQLCGYPKYGGPDPATYICNATKVLAGDWYCPAINCQAHNYASRSSCYSCGTLKSGHAAGGYASDGSDPPGWKTDRDVESITMLAGWNATDAEHPGNTVVDINKNDSLFTINNKPWVGIDPS